MYDVQNIEYENKDCKSLYVCKYIYELLILNYMCVLDKTFTDIFKIWKYRETIEINGLFT
jgi:hypothetical protein